MQKLFRDTFTIYYENTDSSGFTYHTTYLALAERARSNMLRKEFPEVISMLKENLFFFVVKEMNINFLKPSFLFDRLEVDTYFDCFSFTSINLIQRIMKGKTSICEIKVCLVWINGKNKKPARIPSNIISRFKSMEVV